MGKGIPRAVPEGFTFGVFWILPLLLLQILLSLFDITIYPLQTWCRAAKFSQQTGISVPSAASCFTPAHCSAAAAHAAAAGPVLNNRGAAGGSGGRGAGPLLMLLLKSRQHKQRALHTAMGCNASDSGNYVCPSEAMDALLVSSCCTLAASSSI